MSVQINPENLREFASRLGSHIKYFDEAMSQTHALVSNLGQTWRDSQFGEFEDAFARTRAVLLAFIEEANTTRVSLLGDADRAERAQRIMPSP